MKPAARRKTRSPRARFLALFLFTIVLPLASLAVLAMRTIGQEARLTEQRVLKECQHSLGRAVSMIEAKLEPIRARLRDCSRLHEGELDRALFQMSEQEPWISYGFRLTRKAPIAVVGFQAPMDPPTHRVPSRDELLLFDDLALEAERMILREDFVGAREVFERLGHAYNVPFLRARVHWGLARCDLEDGRLEEAMTHLATIFERCRGASGPDGREIVALAGLRLAELHLDLDDPDGALASLSQVIAYLSVDVHRVEPRISDALRRLVEERADECLGASPQSREAWQRALDLSESYCVLQTVFAPWMRPLLESTGDPRVEQSRLIDGEPWAIVALRREEPRDIMGVLLNLSQVRGELLASLEKASMRESTSLRLHFGEEEGMASWTRETLSKPFSFWTVSASPADLSMVEDVRRETVLLQGGFLFAILSVLGVGAFALWRGVRREVELVRMESEFISSVSHELKTPVTAIRMLTEMLHDGKAPPSKRRRYHELIVRESSRLSRLIDNILDFDSLDRSMKAFVFEEQNVEPILREAVELVRHQEGGERFAWRVEIPDGLPKVTVDRDAISQVFVNLLSNAVKYSGEGEEIRIDTIVGKDRLDVRVTDQGPGIAPEDQESIFERFRRHAPNVNGISGVGLGLAIARRIAEAHGGRLGVQSRPGEGSTFVLSLRCQTQKASGVNVRENVPQGVIR